MSNHQEVAFALENELEAIIATVRHEFARGEDAATKKRMKAKKMPRLK